MTIAPTKEDELEAEALYLFVRAGFGREFMKRDGNDFSVRVYVHGLGPSTYDGDELTRFVLACHELRWRGEVKPSGPTHLRFIITKRKHPADCGDFPIAKGHPSMAMAIERYKSGQSWNEFWRSIRENMP